MLKVESEMPGDLPEEVFAILEGNATPEAEAVVDAWLRRDPANRTVLEELRTIWTLTRSPEATGGWAALDRRIDELERVDRPGPARRTFASTRAFALRAAAVLLVGVGLGLLAPRLKQAVIAPQYAHVVVPAGSQTQIELPGGVSIHLNYASELRYEASSDVREVTLQGEAFIRVPDGVRNNLIVHTEAGTVRDLGTEFNVRAREGMTSVTVTEGAVALSTTHGEVTLTAGQESSVAVGGAPIPPVNVDLNDALGWMQRRLTFYDQPLAQVARELQYRYGVVFQVADPRIDSMRITAQISAEATAGDAAEVICMAVQARCTRSGNHWIISPR
jgi:transmembrane sensor